MTIDAVRIAQIRLVTVFVTARLGLPCVAKTLFNSSTEFESSARRKSSSCSASGPTQQLALSLQFLLLLPAPSVSKCRCLVVRSISSSVKSFEPRLFSSKRLVRASMRLGIRPSPETSSPRRCRTTLGLRPAGSLGGLQLRPDDECGWRTRFLLGHRLPAAPKFARASCRGPDCPKLPSVIFSAN